MKGTLILGIILSIIISIFALSNNITVDINYIFGTIQNIPLPILIFFTLAVGILITLLFSIPGWWRNRQTQSALQKEVNKLSNELGDARKKVLELQQSAITNAKTATLTPDDEFMTDVDKE